MSASEDPVVRSARRESLIILATWIIALIWTVGGCYVWGYHRDPREVRMIAGIPDWVVWGILMPWGACYLFSAWFCYGIMEDADLGAERPDAEDDDGL